MPSECPDYFLSLPHLPAPPTELFQFPDPHSLINPDGSTVHQVGIYRQMNLLGSRGLMPCCKPASILASPPAQQWLRSNILEQYVTARINYYIPLPDTANSIGIHTDRLNHWILLYNLEAGGPDAQLVLYQRDGQPIESDPGQSELDPTTLKPIARINGPYHCWYLLNSRVFHDVVGLGKPRINVQISISLPQLDQLRKQII
jgi:hypothetical protein